MSEVKMPQLGETVADGTVAKWFKRPGELVEKGEPLFEVSTDKVDTEIPAQSSGVLREIYVEEGQTVDVGTVLALIEEKDDSTERVPHDAPIASVPPDSLTNVEASDTTPRRSELSPVVRKLLQERGIDAGDVLGSGPGGRVTKDDVLNYELPARDVPTTSSTQSPVVRRLLSDNGLDATSIQSSSPDGRLTRHEVEEFIEQRQPRSRRKADDEILPFSRIRRLTAEHMTRSKATSAHTLMVREVDYESIERFRESTGAAFKEREGFTLTYLPFAAFAAAKALRDFPHLNASVGDNELLVHPVINLGIAVDLQGDGLVVPVISRAESLSVSDLARSISQLALRARESSLGVDDFAGGTFTITNPGPFGTLMTGAIINQPQVAILSTDTVARRPVVIVDNAGEESIAIHSMGLLALTFDHRAVDGSYAARFLRMTSLILQEHDWEEQFSA